MVSKTAHVRRNRYLAIGAVASLLLAGLVTYSGVAAEADTPKSCWISASGDLLDPTAPPGAATPQLALTAQKLESSRLLTSVTSTSLTDASRAQLVPGGLALVQSEVAALKTAKLDKTTGDTATFLARDTAGLVSATFTATQSYKDGTWYVTGKEIRLPAGTDCSKDLLGDG